MKLFLNLFLVQFIVFGNCALLFEKDPGNKLPEISSIDSEFCKTEEKVYDVALVIRGNIRSSTWGDVQDKLVRSDKKEDGDLSIRLQKARAIIAKCANLLYGAVPTDSARNLEDISLKKKKKDIDMSVPMENVESSNEWLATTVPNPDKRMELSLLMNPIDSLPCRMFKGKDIIECSKSNTIQTTKIMMGRELKNVDKHDWSTKKDLDFICPGGFNKPSEGSPEEKILSVSSKSDLEELVKTLPQKMESSNDYKSGRRFRYFFLALADVAYYVEPESIRRWVIDREDIFKEDLAKKFPDYNKSKPAREIETEGAVLEQWLQTSRHGHSFYYKFKYLFRAMDHIGFDVNKKVPELSALHTLLKKTRPDTLKQAYDEFMKVVDTPEVKSNKSLGKLSKSTGFEDFKSLIDKSEELQKKALLQYIDSRKTKKDSVWGKVCKG
ncbi:MAG: hypothetical protein KDK36_19710 [Leptospiraceae bacterium]|nr:hypothetical protein [Leptospiraceae bacterium]